MSEERFARIEFRLDGLQEDVTVLRRDVDDLKVGQAELKTEVIDLRRHMLVLHEEVISTIKALDPAPQIAQLRRESREGLAHLREEICRRLDPLELTVRELVRNPRPPQTA